MRNIVTSITTKLHKVGAESFVSFKKYRNLVNRKLEAAQNKFSEFFFKKTESSKEKWRFIKKKIGKKNNSPNFTETDENGLKSKTKNQYVTLFTEFSAKWASTEGRLFK